MMQQVPVFFPSGELTLHGYIYYPERGKNLPAVVLCHPHPLNGGSMNNNVIRELGSRLAAENIAAMMFNFRGVGKSTGEFGAGIGEQDDVTAALNWITSQPKVDASRIGLCGYSFGGGVAAPVGCQDDRVKALALVTPYFYDRHTEYLRTCNKPKYFVIAEEDDMVPNDTIKGVYRDAAQPKEFASVPGASHFLFGHETILAQNVAAFFERHFFQSI